MARRPATLDAIALIVDAGDIEGNYNWQDEDGGSTWGESASATLSSLAGTFRRMKEIHDPANVQDPF